MPSVHSYVYNLEEEARYANLADNAMLDCSALILNGHNCGMRVRDNALYVRQGKLLGVEREPAVYYKGSVPIKTIVFLGRTGSITLDAFYWCKEQDISIVMLDGIGNIVYSLSPEGESNAKLRRAQYQADATGMDDYIAREMVRQKTTAQIRYLKEISEHLNKKRLMPSISKRGSSLLPVPGMPIESILELLEDGLTELPKVKDIRAMQMLEAELATHYWNAYVGMPLHWSPKDEDSVPPHWKTISERTSTFSGSPRQAICPFQAALNYLYGVAEHLLLCSIRAVGLDPACGFLHFDNAYRDSLVFDLIEPHRAEIDSKVLNFFNRTTLQRGDVIMLPRGQVTLNKELLRYLIISCLPDAKKLGATVTWLVKVLSR